MGLTAADAAACPSRGASAPGRRDPARRPGSFPVEDQEDDRRGTGADRQDDTAPLGSGPYQIQAAIAAYVPAPRNRDTDWTQIDLLYGAGGDAAVGGDAQPRRRRVKGARRRSDAGDDRAAGVAAVELFSFLRRARRLPQCSSAATRKARIAFDRAISLANTSAEAAHIRMHLDRLMRQRHARCQGREVAPRHRRPCARGRR